MVKKKPGFQKGKPKTGGRKKGVQNKTTKETKDRIDKVLSILDETLENDIKEMGHSARVMLWKDLQEYRAPKLSRAEHEFGSESDYEISLSIEKKDNK